jgi:hypothetical protein
VKFKTTDEIRGLFTQYSQLRDALPLLVQPRYVWQHRVPVAELTTYLEHLAATLAAMNARILAAYPELRGVSYGVSDGWIQAVERTAGADCAVDPAVGTQGDRSTRDKDARLRPPADQEPT